MSRIFLWVIGALLLGLTYVVVQTVAAHRSKRRKDWQPVLDREIERWQAKSYQQLLSELVEGYIDYGVEFGSKDYQVEVELLENTPAYLNVAVAVDDGSLPASIAPLTKTFLCRAPDLYGRAS